MFHLLWEAIIGLIVGALAKLVMPGKDPGGIIATMLLGIAGSLVATFIGSRVGLYQEGQSAGFIMSFLHRRPNRLRKKVEESAKTVPSAAKADRFSSSYGTTEVVP